MTTSDVKKIVQRLEKVEKQNRRHKVLGVFAFFLFFSFMVAPQLSAIGFPNPWNAINEIKDFIDFEKDLKSIKFVAQGSSSNDKPRSELIRHSLDFYDNNGNKMSRLSGSGCWSFWDKNGTYNQILCADDDGKIGINTLDPKRALHVSDKGTMVQLRFERTGSAPGVVDMGTANNNFYFYPGGYSKKNGNAIFDTTGYVGIGVHTPQAKLHVNGRVKANNINTGDIVFQKDDQKLWRMFEDEKGLYLENIKSKKVYSFVLKEVK